MHLRNLATKIYIPLEMRKVRAINKWSGDLRFTLFETRHISRFKRFDNEQMERYNLFGWCSDHLSSVLFLFQSKSVLK